MGEDTINFAINNGMLDNSKSITKELKLYAQNTDTGLPYPLSVYGSEANKILEIAEETKTHEKLHPDLPYLCAEVIYQVRYEQAKTVEDVLCRRTRAILLNAKAAIETAPTVAKLMATEMGYDNKWIEDQLDSFNKIAKQYLP